MRRIPLLELGVEIGLGPRGASCVWTWRECEEYPPRPGQHEVLRTRDVWKSKLGVELRFDIDRQVPDAHTLAAMLNADGVARGLIADLREARRRRNCWVRVAIVAGADWRDWPWEAAFSQLGLVVVRRRPFGRRPVDELAFPLRV